MLTGPNVILSLKAAVVLVTILLAASLTALACGRIRLHGRINLAFFVLTVAALLGFEVVIRMIQPEIFHYIDEKEGLRQALNIHLSFAVPSAVLMPLMLFTGLRHRRAAHLALSVVFGVLWLGTLITGLFFLPHTS